MSTLKMKAIQLYWHFIYIHKAKKVRHAKKKKSEKAKMQHKNENLYAGS